MWVLTADSELAEGSMWDAFVPAAHAGLDNLIGVQHHRRQPPRLPDLKQAVLSLRNRVGANPGDPDLPVFAYSGEQGTLTRLA